MEMNNYASKAVGNAGLTTGIIGTALGALNGMGGLNGLFGGGCAENMPVSRYDAEKSARIAELETEVKLRDANTYTMAKVGELRDYVERKLDCVNASINAQAVVNAQITANISCMQNTINTLSALTKTVVPIDSICPEPMKMYNSWTAPTAGA